MDYFTTLKLWDGTCFLRVALMAIMFKDCFVQDECQVWRIVSQVDVQKKN